MHVEYADEQIENAPVDDEGDGADHAEFEDLFNEFAHGTIVLRAAESLLGA